MTAEGWAIIIGAIFLGAGQLLNIWLTRMAAAKAAEKLDVISTDAKIVKAHVNSEATRALGEKSALEKENAILREVIAKQDGDKQLLAQAVAARVRPPDPEAEAPTPKEQP
jgi:hypothetical protein